MPVEEKVVHYTLTRKDLFAFNLYALLRNRVVQFSTVPVILVMTYFAYTTFNFQPPPETEEPPMALRIIATVIVSVLLPIAYVGFILLFLVVGIWSGKYKTLLCPHELRLSEAGMFSKSTTSETTRKWNGLIKLASTKNYLFLYVNETTAQIVPKRFFASAAEALSFEEMIRERMKAG